MKFPSKFIPHLIALGAFAILAVVSGLLWLERSSRFPLPPVGAYLGKISGLKANGGADIVLYAERSSDEPKFMLAAACEGCSTAFITVDPARFKDGEESVLPVELTLGGMSHVRLRGTRTGPSELVGRADDLVSGEHGSWELKSLGNRGPTAFETDDKRVKLWLNLKAEVVENENQILEVKRRIPEMEEEVDRLSSFITDKSRLQGAADDKFQTVKTELDAAKGDLKVKQDRAKELEARLSLALRVTSMGRLVSLSRESLERENRWIESMLRASSSKETAAESLQASQELEQEMARGEQVMRLKQEIRAERERILALRGDEGKGEGE